MKEKLQEYALIAEILGAIAVVISLIFVGSSVKQNTNAVLASNHQAMIAMDMSKNDWLKDPEFAAVVVIANEEPSKLGPAQTLQYEVFVANIFNAWEFAFISHNNGMMDENMWVGWDGFYSNGLKQNNGYQSFWSGGRENFTPEFRVYADSILIDIQ